MALSMQSATLAGKQITSAKVSSKRYVFDRAMSCFIELREEQSHFFYASFFLAQYSFNRVDFDGPLYLSLNRNTHHRASIFLLLLKQFGQQDGPSVQLVGEALQGGRHCGHHRRVVRIGAFVVFL